MKDIMTIDEIIEEYDLKFKSGSIWDIITDEFDEMLKNSGIVLLKSHMTEDVEVRGALWDLYTIFNHKTTDPIYLTQTGFIKPSYYDVELNAYIPSPEKWKIAAAKVEVGFGCVDKKDRCPEYFKGVRFIDSPEYYVFRLAYLKDLPHVSDRILDYDKIYDIVGSSKPRNAIVFDESLGKSGLTEVEEIVSNKLIDAWNYYVKLPVMHESDQREFQSALHELQRLLSIRIVRRAFPDYWSSSKLNNEES